MNVKEEPLCGGTKVRKMPEEVKKALAEEKAKNKQTKQDDLHN